MDLFARLPARGRQSAGVVGEYKLGKTLGSGQYGQVKQSENVVTGELAAVKIVPNAKMDAVALQKEVDIQRRLDHRHVVKVLDVVETSTETYIAMELVSGGDLFEHLTGQVRLAENEARRLFQQLIAGVEHCHSRGVAHRDLKPENLLLDKDRNIKIADFGLSAVMVEGELLTDSCGSPNYAAPELLRKGCQYQGPEVDVWSCGVILYALLCNGLPFDADDVSDLFKKIKRGRYHVPGYVTPNAQDLLSKMLKVNCDERISIAQIREHVWFQKNLPTGLMRSAESPDVANTISEDAISPSRPVDVIKPQHPTNAVPAATDYRKQKGIRKWFHVWPFLMGRVHSSTMPLA